MARVLSMRYLIPVFVRGTASVRELNICHHVRFTLRAAHRGVWGVCFRFYGVFSNPGQQTDF